MKNTIKLMKSPIEHIEIPVKFTYNKDQSDNFSIDLRTIAKTATKMKLLADIDELEEKLTNNPHTLGY